MKSSITYNYAYVTYLRIISSKIIILSSLSKDSSTILFSSILYIWRFCQNNGGRYLM